MDNGFSDSTLYINLEALKANYKTIVKKANNSETAAVVKANGYGLGVKEISQALESAGCRKFFVANLDEAIELRNIIKKSEILVFNGIRQGQEKIFQEYKIIPVLNNFSEIELWQKFSKKNNKLLPSALHVDTGMNRLGLPLAEAQQIPNEFRPKYLMSHLACADDPAHPLNEQQYKRFNKVRKFFPDAIKSLANSSGVFLKDCYHFDLVRPGISLYGGTPNISLKDPVKPVISLTSKIISLRKIDTPQAVGYGASAILPKNSKIAVIPVGYADGYLRSLSNHGECYIGNKKAKIAGRISMDLLILDVTKIPEKELYLGQEVELIGKNLKIDDVAAKAGTIAYEILTRLGKRFNKVYLEK